MGLVAGSCFAESGHDVICIDSDRDKVKALSEGQVPIYEPGLREIVQRNFAQGHLRFTTDLPAAVKQSFVLFIAVGTPQLGGEIDLSAVRNVAAAIGRSMKDFKVVVMKSTVPVGTTEQIRDVIRAETDQPFDVVSNPEFMKEGAAVEDFMKPDRVVLGVEDERAAEVVREIYAPFVRTGNPVLVTDIRTAEMTKYASNAYLATRVSFMNEIANMCEYSGANVDVVRRAMGLDRRIGSSFLFPGIGFGGSCFPKDVKALIASGRRHDNPLRILEAVAHVNAHQRVRFLERIIAHFDGDVTGKRLAVWGLSFKPRTNDIREAPAIDIIEGLLDGGATVVAYDPEAMEEARKVFASRVKFAGSGYECLAGADALILTTEWQAFRNPNFERMKDEMRQPTVFDGRNVYDPQQMREMGFTYYGIGRK